MKADDLDQVKVGLKPYKRVRKQSIKEDRQRGVGDESWSKGDGEETEGEVVVMAG